MRTLSNIVVSTMRQALLGWVLLLGLALVGAAPRAQAAAPPNDAFVDAIPISDFWGTTNGTLAGATSEPEEPSHAGWPAQRSVWYAFTPIMDGTLVVHTFGSVTNTRLGIYTFPVNTNGNIGTLFPVAANDDLNLANFNFSPNPFLRNFNVNTMMGPNGPAMNNGPSFVRFPVKLGTTYYIAVDGSAGNYSLTWGYNFAGLFYMTKPQSVFPKGVEAAKWEGNEFAISRVFGAAGRVTVQGNTLDYTNNPNYVPATANLDYDATWPWSVTFDEYEMTKTFTVRTFDSGLTNANLHFLVTITNVVFDRNENTNLIAPPLILKDPASGTDFSVSVGRMLDWSQPRGWGDPPLVFPYTNSDFIVNIGAKHYVLNEHGGPSWGIPITRQSAGKPCNVWWGINSSSMDKYHLGDLHNNWFDLWPESDYATPPPPDTSAPGLVADFNRTGTEDPQRGGRMSGTISFGAGVTTVWLYIPFVDDNLPEFNEDFRLEIIPNPDENPPSALTGQMDTCILTIANDPDDQPAGGLEYTWNPSGSANSQPPNNLSPGANGIVMALAVQPDQKAVIGGQFTAYNSYLRNNIARVNANGLLDTSFDPGNGADGVVSAVAIQPDDKILLAGDFFAVGGVDRYGVARLTPSGTVDLTFNPGVGADDAVWAMALGQINGTNSIVLGGQFYSFNDLARTHVVKLDPQGQVDPVFDTSNLRLNGIVWAVALQADGKVVIGGDFTTVNGVLRSHIARLNADGSLDSSFNTGLGANDAVYALQVQADGNILVGGAFTQFHIAAHHGVTRLQPSGALDPTFSPGSAANGVVYAVYLSSADNTIYVGGKFTSFNGTRRMGLARLFADGTVDTGFLDTAYNQYAGFINPGFNPDRYPPRSVYAIGLQNYGGVADVLVGGDFIKVGGGNTTPGEHGLQRHSQDVRRGLALLRGGSTVGPGNITLSEATYSVDDFGQHRWVTQARTNGTLGIIGTRFAPDPLPVGSGAALYGVDYTYNPVRYGLSMYSTSWGWWNTAYNWPTRMLSDGVYDLNIKPKSVVANIAQPDSFNNCDITIADLPGANRSFSVNLDTPWQHDTFFLGGANIPLGAALGAETTTSTMIVGSAKNHGTFSFITTNYSFSEGVGTATIQVVRTNGTDERATLDYFTYDLPPAADSARSNVNYVAVTKTTPHTLTFQPGVGTNSFSVTIKQDHVVTPDLKLLLVITNFQPADIQGGITNAYLTIVDQDFVGGHLNFSSAAYVTNETAGAAVVTVTRTGSSRGRLTVDCYTTNTLAGPNNTPAVPGTNYFPAFTNLSWEDGDSSPRVFVVPILHDGVITPNLTVGLVLASPTLNALANPGTLGPVSSAVLTILNVDQTGTVSFSRPSYNQNENGAYAIIPVVRQGGLAETITVNFTASGVSAVAGADFVATNGTLSFGPGELSKVFTVPLLDNSLQDGIRQVSLKLSGGTPTTNVLGYPQGALLNIMDDETYNEPPGVADSAFTPLFDGPVNSLALQPDGKIVAAGAFTVVNAVTRHYAARLYPDGSLDYTFASLPGGANGPVRSLALQSDGRMLVGGEFTNYDTSVRNYFARLNLDGTVEVAFDPGSGLNGFVNSVVETFTDTNRTSRKILAGGNFTLANGTPRNYLARFNDNGSLDAGFNVNLTGPGLDGQVWAVAVQPDLKVVIGGDFHSINGVSREHVARLHPDGSLDLSFDPGTGANDSVRALAIQLDGRIVVGGLFTNFNGTLQNYYTRLNMNGSLDTNFHGGVGADGPVLAIALQPDTRILLGGSFTRCSGVTRHRLTRLNPDGTVDPAINFGNGFDSYVASLVVQTNDYIVLGGGFTTYDEAPPSYLTRIFGRSVAGSGRFQFTKALYGVDETGTNAVLSLRRHGGTDGTSSGPNVSVTVSVRNGTATNGVNFVGGLFTNFFAPGETYQSIVVPVMHDFQITSDLWVTNEIVDIQPLGLSLGIGNQPLAKLIISNVDSGVAFSAPTYSVAKDVQQGRATIPVYRVGSLRGTALVDVRTTPGTAVPYQRYIPTTNTLIFGPGDTMQKAFVRLNTNDTQILGDTTVGLALANPSNTLIAAPSTATLTILETTTAPGTLAFASDRYSVSERASSVVLTVQRSNGKSGAVTVDYATAAGSAASGSLFVATNGTLTFADGETLKSVVVPIRYNPVALGNQTFTVNLSNPQYGASLGSPGSSTVTVLEEDTAVQFDAASVSVGKYETDGQVALNVLRPYGTNGVTQVDYATTNGNALAGSNYVAVSGTLTFNPGVMFQSITVPLLHDPRVTGDLTFGVNLSNPTGGAQLIPPTAASVRLFDVEAGLSFTTTTNSVLESAGTALLTVVCANANMMGTGTVAYATADGTALAGRDYTFTNGVLAFWSDHLTNTIAVPILDNTGVEGNRSFTVSLFNATAPGQLVAPTNMTVTILDDDVGVSFASESYTVIKNSGNASVSVIRTGYTNCDLAVNFTTLDDSALAKRDYDATNGVVTLAAGQMSTNIAVTLLGGATVVVDPDRTFRVQLTNAVVVPNPAQPAFGGSAKVVYPGNTAITIVDTSGSLVVPAGSALVSESITPANGMIDPGETVKLWFAFRVAGGLNVSNLQATLLATNNVLAPSEPQLYGPLIKNGPSASRQFSFTASGTNGQQIAAMFSLSDGTNSLGQVQFTYTLGTSTASFTNNTPIVINDFASATPYPSVITVTNGGGALRKLTVTLTNFSHTYPKDVDVLLVSPAGTNSYLMAECGGGNKVNKPITLTFDDAASAGLSDVNALTSGTYRPTSYASAGLNLRSPAPPGPYGVGLSAFNGSNPLGDWQLFIIDDALVNSGAIAAGWYMTLTTANPVVGKADLVTAVSAHPNPAVITSNITYAVAVTNYGPASAANVVVTNVLPPATTFVSSGSTAGFDTNTVPGCVIYRLGTLDKDAVARLTINATSTATNQVITNWVWAFSDTAEAYADNNTNQVSLVVTNFAADLAVSQTAAPAPNVPNGTLTYNILVSNLGPATAPNVRVVDTLPPLGLLSLVSVSPNTYVTNGGLLIFTNLGSLGSGTSTNLTITVHLLGAGTLENTVDVSSDFVDPSKGNNSDTIKTLVAAPSLTLATSPNALTLSWPELAEKYNYVLETATNLRPPVIWTQVATPPSTNGQISLPVDTGNGTRFFRLRGPTP